MLRIEFTESQRRKLLPALAELATKPGGSIMAQVWGDGIVVKVLTAEDHQSIAQLTGADTSKRHNSSLARVLPK